MIMNNSRLSYVSPKEKFEKIHMNVILKFEPEVVGIYCKLVTMSSGKSMSISWLSKKMGINERRMRKTIVLLEEEGYITREPLKDEKCRITGWNYELYAEPVRADKRTHAGKPTLSKNHPDENPPCTKSTKVENGQDINNYTNSISINNTDSFKETDKKELLHNSKKDPKEKKELSEPERRFEEGMMMLYPRVMKMEQPLTYQQSQELKKEFSDEEIKRALDEMEVYKPLLKQRVNTYRTIINWIKRSRDYGK